MMRTIGHRGYIRWTPAAGVVLALLLLAGTAGGKGRHELIAGLDPFYKIPGHSCRSPSGCTSRT